MLSQDLSIIHTYISRPDYLIEILKTQSANRPGEQITLCLSIVIRGFMQPKQRFKILHNFMQPISWHFSSPWDVCIYDSIERELNQPSNTISLFSLTLAFCEVFWLQWHTNIKKKIALHKTETIPTQGENKSPKGSKSAKLLLKRFHFTQLISKNFPHSVWLHLGS